MKNARISLETAIITNEDSLERLRVFFNNDFTENEEYYREDTLSLGYVDEADRVIKEKIAQWKPGISKNMFDLINEVLDIACEKESKPVRSIDMLTINGEVHYFVAAAILV